MFFTAEAPGHPPSDVDGSQIWSEPHNSHQPILEDSREPYLCQKSATIQHEIIAKKIWGEKIQQKLHFKHYSISRAPQLLFDHAMWNSRFSTWREPWPADTLDRVAEEIPGESTTLGPSGQCAHRNHRRMGPVISKIFHGKSNLQLHLSNPNQKVTNFVGEVSDHIFIYGKIQV